MMAAAAVRPRTLDPPPTKLSGPFALPPDPKGLRPTPPTERLVRTQVRSLLEATPSFHALDHADRSALESRLNHVASYAAECLRDIYWQSEKLGQTPVLKETRASHQLPPRTAQAQANDFKPRAASQIGSITQQTLRAIAFPTFVADLIRGTFDAILQTNIRQMEAFSKLLSNVSKTVDQFMQDNVTDEGAHAWLAQSYPRHLTLKDGRAVPVDGSDQLPPPDFEKELHVSASLDESAIEETLLPAARRRLAETRLQMLSTMVLMGINRIVITAGKIRATMGFHIDTSDSAFERTAEDIDARTAVRGHYNALLWGVEASASLAYVSSKRGGSDAEINTQTDLTGEVELHFKSDYFPIERFAPNATLKAISANTAVPEANPAPVLATPQAGPPPGGDGPAFKSPKTRQRPREAPPAMTPVGAPLPAPRLPDAPIEHGALDPGAKNPVPAPASDKAKSDAGGEGGGEGEGDKPGTGTGGDGKAKPKVEAKAGEKTDTKADGKADGKAKPKPGGAAKKTPETQSAEEDDASSAAQGMPWTVH